MGWTRRLCTTLALTLAVAGCRGNITDEGPLRPGERQNELDLPDFEPAAPLARRLTKDEYIHTLRDELGVELGAEDRARLPDDLPVGGFVNTAQGQATLPDHVRAYSELATAAAEQMDFAGFVAEHAACTDGADASCGRSFVESAGERLFRRPLDDRERDDFTALHDAVLAEGVSFEEASQAVFEAMLQSPQFLFLHVDEVADDRTITGFAMASRLSYFLWMSAPDDELLAAAAAGDLDTADGVARQAARMLDDPRARRTTERFLHDWARLGTLPDPDGRRAQLVDSAIAFYQHHVWDSGEPLFAMFTAPRAALTEDLAAAWGLTPLDPGVALYDLSETEGLPGGLLAQPGIVAGMTNADGGEIVARGLFMLGQVFCSDVPAPPANLSQIAEEFLAELPEDASNRLIAEERLNRSDCGYCHGGFDPLGYAFESFDYRGALRDADDHGNPVVSDGWIPGDLSDTGRDRPYADAAELSQLLATNLRVQTCVAQRHLEYAIGGQLRLEQRAAARDLAVELAERDGDYRALVDAIVRHDAFRTFSPPETSE